MSAAHASFAILATAGHIDHGKTALVRRLTGVDTDRLPEERARGISIDLGFASLALPNGVTLGIVDVPGHERFIKNMLAGVGGIDVVVLVVAVDEGVMPQTREHLDIVTLLGVTRGIVALTKSDLVDAEWRTMIEADVRAALAHTTLADAPIVPVSSTTGDGIPQLTGALIAATSDLPPRGLAAPARLPVDRVFVVEGFGTVVTGTLWRGALRVGDTVGLEPSAQTTRVRSLEVHGRSVNEAHAGQRTAVALHAVPREKVARGEWVVAPGSLRASRFVDVRVRALASLPDALRSGARVRIYLGASEVLGRIVLLEGGPRLAPGESVLAQLRCESPIVADRGDLFVLRSYSPLATIGGGTVLDPVPARHRGRDPELVRRLETAESGTPLERLSDALRAAGATPASLDALARSASLAREEVSALMPEVGVAIGSGFVHADTAADAALRVVATARDYQREHPLRWGITKGEMKSRLAKMLSPALFDAALAAAVSNGGLYAREDRLRADTAALALAPAHARAHDMLAATLTEARFAPPNADDVCTDVAARAHVSLEDARELLAHAAFEGRVERISSDFVYASGALVDVIARVREHFARTDTLAVGDMKDACGVSRKHAVPLLEWLDRQGYTSRRGDTRVAGRALTTKG